jgi:hypothetical protein
MMYWLFALPTLVIQWWPAAPLIWSALFQTAMVLAIVWLADRIGGRSLSLITAIGILLLCVPAGARQLYTIWNPYVAILPLLLLAFVTVEIVLGRYQLVWLAALLATFVVQTYLTLAPAALLLAAIITIAVGVVVLRWLRAGRATRLPNGLHHRSLVATAIILFVCWLPPVVQQLKDSPGNLGLLLKTARARPTDVFPSFSYSSVAHVKRLPRVGVSHALPDISSLVLFWPRRLVERKATLAAAMAGPHGTAGTVLAIATLAAMAGLVAFAVWRRERVVAAMGAISLALLVAGVAAGASQPTGPLGVDSWWGLVWFDMVAMLVWVTFAWALWRAVQPLLVDRWPSRGTMVSESRRSAAALVGGGALLVAALLIAIPGQRRDDNAWAYRFVRRATAAVADNGHPPYVVQSTGISAVSAGAGPGLLLALRARSIPVRVPDDYVAMLGQHYGLPLGSRATLVQPLEASIGPTSARNGTQTILAMPVDLSEGGRRVTAVVAIRPTGP